MKNHRPEIVKQIRKVWESLESHLDHSIEIVKIPKKLKEAHGGVRFHRQCVRDYAKQILDLSKIL